MFTLAISSNPPVTFDVRGSLPSDNGRLSSFAFRLTADRATQDDLEAVLEDLGKGGQTVRGFLSSRVNQWSDVRDESGQDVPFDVDAFGRMLNIIGMPGVIFAAYLEACGAKGKAKN